MEKKLFISLIGTLLLLAYPNDCSPENSGFWTTEIILQSLDTGDLSEEQLALLREELDIYQKDCDALMKTDLKAWKEKMSEMFRKLAQGFKIYNLVHKNPELKTRVEEFTRQTNVEVYILAYVEDAFLNNIFQRLAETRYNMIRRAHVKMKYKFKKATSDSSDKFTVKLELIYDSALVDLLRTKLANGYKDYSDLTLEASANKDLQKAGIQDIFDDAASENTSVDPTAEDILDKLSSTNVEATNEEPDYLSVMVCDSIVKNEKIYYWTKDCILRVKMENKDTANVKEINLGMTINITSPKSIKTYSYVMKDFENWVTLKVDSLPEGKYTLVATINGKPQKKTFYLRKNKSDYSCVKCGRDLTVTLKRLVDVFPKNDALNTQDADLFNKALKIAGFNTCKKQIHFFSQVRCESDNFTKFKESAEYSLPRYLYVFYENCNVKGVFNQSFWNTKTYKKYFFTKVYEFDSLSKRTQYMGKEIKTHNWAPRCSGAIKGTGDTIQCPITFSIPLKKEKGSYALVTYSALEKAENQKRLFSLTYANIIGNGDSSSHDGYNFFGKGALQLTGRANYKDVSLKANKIYGTSFDWVKNYDEIAEKRDAIIYSATAFFLYRIKDLNILDKSNVTEATKLVNGGSNGLKERKEFFNELISIDLYDCAIPKE